MILASVAIAATAQLTLKAGMDRVEGTGSTSQLLTGAAKSPLVWVGLALFGFSALVWLVVLSKAPLSFAYPFASLSYVLIILADRFILHYEVPPLRWAGVGLVIAGILVIAATLDGSVGTKG